MIPSTQTFQAQFYSSNSKRQINLKVTSNFLQISEQVDSKSKLSVLPLTVHFRDTNFILEWIYSSQSTLNGLNVLYNDHNIIGLTGSETNLKNLKKCLDGRVPYGNSVSHMKLLKCLKQTQNSKILQVSDESVTKIVKIIDRQKGGNELENLRILFEKPHPNVLSFSEFHITDENIYLVMEQYSSETLYNLHQKYKAGIPKNFIRTILQQILEGIQHIHSQDIIHRDIKYDNILITDDLQIAIIDFGFAIRYIDRESFDTFSVGTIGYIAPEVFRGEKLTTKLDIFSTGIVFHKLLSNQNLFKNIFENKHGQINIHPSITDDIAVDLLKNMLQPNPLIRYSASDCLSHPYFIGEEQCVGDQLKRLVTISPAPKKLQALDPATFILES